MSGVCAVLRIGWRRFSLATVVHDDERQRWIYERHGVREYWLVHPVERMFI
jgi:hypothetical protein